MKIKKIASYILEAFFNDDDFTAYNLVVTGPHIVRKRYDDLVISCEIDRRTTFRNINLIGLEKRNGEDEKRPVFFITDETEITWQDPYLQHRRGVNVSGDITSVQSAYLTFTISRDYVECDNDSASYSCFMGGIEQNGTLSTQFTKDYPVKVLGKLFWYIGIFLDDPLEIDRLFGLKSTLCKSY
jgi:hypothetical protein